MPTKEELKNYCRKHRIKGYSNLQKAELERLVNKHKKWSFERNKHKWKRTGISITSGIAFALWECEICGEEDDTMIGEILSPKDV